MTTKRAVYTNAEGGVSVVVPNPRNQRPGESEQDFLARVLGREAREKTPRLTNPDGSFAETVEAWDARVATALAARRVIERADLPTSKRWRSAWRLVGQSVVPVLALARGIRRQELIERRDTLLEPLRARRQKALEQDDVATAATLKARLQRLHSLDPDLSAVASLDALDQVRPADLYDPV